MIMNFQCKGLEDEDLKSKLQSLARNAVER